jgi:predicted metal-binding membrane protein
MASTPPSLTSLSEAAFPRGGRLAAGAGIAVLLGLCWAYLLYMVWGMENMDEVADSMLMPAMVDWSGADLVLVFVMWTIMMAAMMLPSAAPMLMLFGKVSAARAKGPRAALAVGVLALGYLAAWTAFSAIATLAQWGLLEARLVSPMMSSASPALSAALLIAAGAYQFTPLKNACLARCRSPLSFLLNDWREGLAGAFCMGLRQGVYCTGCCWLLMALLFVFGVMNLVWIAALTVFVLVEKLLGRPRWFAPATGALLIAWGAGIAYQAANLVA